MVSRLQEMLCKRFSLCPENPTTSSSPGQHSGNFELLHLQDRFLLEAGKGQPNISSPETRGIWKNTDQKNGSLIFDLDFVTSRWLSM